ncbi:hypothetical protein ACN28G_19740 [Micromonospora sp. WMMA1923]|uniref:hypothetical protein n=1 Tax=Micromonospora sp. WMMA1923 TaxID=3404125 RepID=UPI003B94D3D9
MDNTGSHRRLTTAAIYVTAPNLRRYTDRCADYCNRRGLTLTAVVVDDLGGGRWPEVVQMVMDGTVQVVVVADRDELPPDRTPRLDVVAEERRHLSPDPQRGCRPRLLH